MFRPVAIAALVLVSAASTASTAAGTRKSVSIGATLPLTGSESKGGNGYREGYELAVERENADGGVNVGGRRIPVVLKIVDDQSKADNAVRLARELVEKDNVDLLLGTFSSALADPQSAVAEKLQVPYVVAASAKSIFTRGSRYVFGTQSPVDLLADAELRWIDEQQKSGAFPAPARIAVVWENTSHGKDYRSGVLDFTGRTPSRRAAYQVVLDESFELNNKDWKPLLNRVRDARVDALLVDAHLADYIAMQKQYAAMGLCHKVLSYGARGPEKEALAALPPHAADFILSAVWWNAQLGDKGTTKEFVDLFKRKYGREPEWYQALGYESARALFAAVEKASSADREKVRDALANLKMESIVPGGYLTFPKDYGQMAHYLFVVQQNRPDGSAPIIYPKIAATYEGTLNPRCSAASTAAK